MLLPLTKQMIWQSINKRLMDLPGYDGHGDECNHGKDCCFGSFRCEYCFRDLCRLMLYDVSVFDGKSFSVCRACHLYIVTEFEEKEKRWKNTMRRGMGIRGRLLLKWKRWMRPSRIEKGPMPKHGPYR